MAKAVRGLPVGLTGGSENRCDLIHDKLTWRDEAILGFAWTVSPPTVAKQKPPA